MLLEETPAAVTQTHREGAPHLVKIINSSLFFRHSAKLSTTASSVRRISIA